MRKVGNFLLVFVLYLLNDLCDTIASSLQTLKTTFDRVVTASRWIATNGLRLFLQFWFAKKPLFWIPVGWLPGHVEWFLAFPRAPRGSVSIQIWGIACATVLQISGEAVVAVWILVNTSKGEGQVEKVKSGDKKREG